MTSVTIIVTDNSFFSELREELAERFARSDEGHQVNYLDLSNYAPRQTYIKDGEVCLLKYPEGLKKPMHPMEHLKLVQAEKNEQKKKEMDLQQRADETEYYKKCREGQEYISLKQLIEMPTLIVTDYNWLNEFKKNLPEDFVAQNIVIGYDVDGSMRAAQEAEGSVSWAIQSMVKNMCLALKRGYFPVPVLAWYFDHDGSDLRALTRFNKTKGGEETGLLESEEGRLKLYAERKEMLAQIINGVKAGMREKGYDESHYRLIDPFEFLISGFDEEATTQDENRIMPRIFHPRYNDTQDLVGWDEAESKNISAALVERGEAPLPGNAIFMCDRHLIEGSYVHKALIEQAFGAEPSKPVHVLGYGTSSQRTEGGLNIINDGSFSVFTGTELFFDPTARMKYAIRMADQIMEHIGRGVRLDRTIPSVNVAPT